MLPSKRLLPCRRRRCDYIKMFIYYNTNFLRSNKKKLNNLLAAGLLILRIYEYRKLCCYFSSCSHRGNLLEEMGFSIEELCVVTTVEYV